MPNEGLETPQRYWAAFAIAIGVCLSVIDSSIVNLALPIIADDFNVTATQSVLVVNAYQLVAAVSLLPLAGLGDKIGYRQIYLAGFTTFILSSFWCSISGNLFSLTLARALQGLGAAGLMCVGPALVRSVYPPSLLGRGIGINAMVVAGSTAAGPSIAAVILSVSSWQWLFLINVPIGIIGVFISLKFLPKTPASTKPFDTRSAILSALTFGSLLFFVESLGQGEPLTSVFWQLIVVLIVGTIFIRRQLNIPHPMLPVDLLYQPQFALSVMTAICSFTAVMLSLVSLPFYLSNKLGLDVIAIGLLYTAWPLSIMCMAVLAGRLADEYSAGILGAIGLSIAATGLFLLSNIDADASSFDIIWRMFICGAGFGLFQSPNTRLILSSAPHHRSGSVSGMIGTIRLSGQTIGASLAALMLHLYADDHGQSSLLLATGLTCLAALISLSRLCFKPQVRKVL